MLIGDCDLPFPQAAYRGLSDPQCMGPESPVYAHSTGRAEAIFSDARACFSERGSATTAPDAVEGRVDSEFELQDTSTRANNDNRLR